MTSEGTAAQEAAPRPPRRLLPARWTRPGPEAVLLVLLAFGVRVLTVAARPAILPDSADLLDAAEAVRTGGADALLSARHHPVPVALLALLSRFGDPALLGSLAAAALGSLAVFPLHVVARRACGRHGATTAGLLYAVLPKFVSVSSVPLAEAVFLPFFVGAAAAAMSAGIARTPGRRWFRLAVSGASAGAAYLCRPEGLVIGAAAVVGACVLARRGRRLVSAAAVAAAFAVVSGPWVAALSADRGALTLSPKKDVARFVGAAPTPLDERPETTSKPPDGAAGVRATAEALWDALGPALPLVAFGAFPRRRWSRRRGHRPRWILLGTAAVLVALVIRLHAGWGYAGGRHALGAATLLLPFAGEGAVAAFALLPLVRRRRRAALWLTTMLAVPLALRAVLRPDGESGERERDLGAAVAEAARGRGTGDVVVASFAEPLVAWYADRSLAPAGRRVRNHRLLRTHGRLLDLSADLDEQRARLAADLRAAHADWLVLNLYATAPSAGGRRTPGRELAARLVEDGVLGTDSVACGSELAAFPVLR